MERPMLFRGARGHRHRGARRRQAAGGHGRRRSLADGGRAAPAHSAKPDLQQPRGGGGPIDVAVAPDGGAYIATLRDGLVRVMPDGHAGPADVELPDRWLLHVGLDRVTGQLWIGTQAGAARLGKGTEVLRDGAELPNPCVHTVAALPEGTWLGTEGGTLLIPR